MYTYAPQVYYVSIQINNNKQNDLTIKYSYTLYYNITCFIFIWTSWNTICHMENILTFIQPDGYNKLILMEVNVMLWASRDIRKSDVLHSLFIKCQGYILPNWAKYLWFTFLWSITYIHHI